MKLIFVKPSTVGTSEYPARPVLDYPATWASFWERWIGVHSMMRCPGGHCPGGCGAGAKDHLASLAKAAEDYR